MKKRRVSLTFLKEQFTNDARPGLNPGPFQVDLSKTHSSYRVGVRPLLSPPLDMRVRRKSHRTSRLPLPIDTYDHVATGEVRALEIDRVREDQFVRRLIGH